MIRSHRDMKPRIAATAYIDESAVVIGDVVIGEHSSVWPNAVIRGDVNSIRIGSETNIQDHCVLHVDQEKDIYALGVGDRVTVGHRVVLHGCLIGIGSVILNGARVGTGSIVAAGAVVPENTVIPPGSLCMGVPATVRRKVSEDELRRIESGADNYVKLKNLYLGERRGKAAE
jgi:carbonic anhydrase/acetyltransferase-like protein (isoleucine patch superfamily)